MPELNLTVTIRADSREDLIYWLERLHERIKDSPTAISGRMSGGGCCDWSIDEVSDDAG